MSITSYSLSKLWKKSQAVLGKAKSDTISQKGKHWFVSIQVERKLAKLNTDQILLLVAI